MKQKPGLDEFDKWAENVGKHCYGGKPLSAKNLILTTIKTDRDWKRFIREQENKSIQL